MNIYQTSSSAATEKLGELLARKILSVGPKKNAAVVGLSGWLGSGKTTFIRGFFRGAGLRKRALSPTFILMRRLTLKNKKFKSMFHIDAYRVEHPRELVRLGLNEAAGNPQNIILIEWADKLKNILPRDIIWLKFKHGRKQTERIIATRTELNFNNGH